jgi:hypothetical protein
MKADQFLETAKSLVTGARADAYGDMKVNHENIAALWSQFLGVRISAEQVAIMMMLMKIARTMSAGQHQQDTYVDMCGYASIAGEISWRESQ